MKNFLLILFTIISLMSCSSNNNDNEKINVKFFVNNNIEITSRASVTEAEIKYLNFYCDGEKVLTQTTSDSDFGTPTIALPTGNHMIAIIGSNNEVTNCSLKPSSITYGYTENMEITSVSTTKTITLKRIVAGLRLHIEDALPDGLDSIIINTPEYYNSFSPITLYGINSYNKNNKITIPSSYIGTTNLTASTYTLCPGNDEYTQNINVKFYINGKVKYSYTFNDIPLIINRITILKGTWFSTSSTNTITVDNSAMEEDIHNINQ